jgi:hypothetical protein
MRLTSCVLSLLWVGGTVAYGAQSSSSEVPGVPKVKINPIPVVQPDSGGSWGGGGGYGGYYESGSGSTAFGSAASGMADLVRSSGQANLQNSAAAINYQQAQRSAMENNWIAAEGYFQGRQMNKAYREAEASPRATQADLVRYAKSGAPKRMSPSELDPLTGYITWPSLLADKAYQADRKTLDAAFAYRAKQGQFNLDQRTKVQQAAESLAAAMKKNINAYAPQDYVQAKKFLEQLTYESRLPTA